MIVLVILSILVVLAIPSFGDTDVSRLQAAANLLAADLAAAQFESIAHGDDLRVVVFDTTNHRYHVAASSDTATPITNPGDNLPYLVEYGAGRAGSLAGVTISGLSVGGDDQLQFGVYGELDQSTAATITLSSGGLSVTITIDPVSGDTAIGNIS